MCGGGGGGRGVDGSSVGGTVGVVVLMIVVKVLRELCIGVVEVVAVLWIGLLEMYLSYFCLIHAWFFGGYGGCESRDRGWSWCGSVSLVGVVCGLKMDVAAGCV